MIKPLMRLKILEFSALELEYYLCFGACFLRFDYILPPPRNRGFTKPAFPIPDIILQNSKSLPLQYNFFAFRAVGVFGFVVWDVADIDIFDAGIEGDIVCLFQDWKRREWKGCEFI